jgi:hypothetical protein
MDIKMGKPIENRAHHMRIVQQLITELSNFPADKKVRFFSTGFSGEHGCIETELFIFDYDQDEDGNPTFLMERKSAEII